MIKKYRKKPVIIEALKWDGKNRKAVLEFCDDLVSTDPSESKVAFGNTLDDDLEAVYIHTLEGVMRASSGDYIIKGISGEFYPCNPDIFHKTYEEVADEYGG